MEPLDFYNMGSSEFNNVTDEYFYNLRILLQSHIKGKHSKYKLNFILFNIYTLMDEMNIEFIRKEKELVK